MLELQEDKQRLESICGNWCRGDIASRHGSKEADLMEQLRNARSELNAIQNQLPFSRGLRRLAEAR